MIKFKDMDTYTGVLIAAVHGLYDQANAKGRDVRMSQYVEADGGICYACFATCAIQRLTGKMLVSGDECRSDFYGVDYYDLYEFEGALDDFRNGCTYSLKRYFGLDLPRRYSLPYGFMTTENWRERIPKMLEHVEKVQAWGKETNTPV